MGMFNLFTTVWDKKLTCSQRPKDSTNLLQRQELPKTHRPQGHSIQNRQSLRIRSGNYPYLLAELTIG